MLVTFVDTLTVSDYFELARFGQIVLFEGGRPRQFTETSPPSVAGYAAHLDDLTRRQVILDDDNNAQNAYLRLGPTAASTSSIRGPTAASRSARRAPTSSAAATWSTASPASCTGRSPGTGADAWRIRPTAATPAAFTVANPRPATPPAVGGAIKAARMNLLNYFTTIDTTPSSTTGPCGPSGTQDCRGADSVAELNRQRERPRS